MLSTLIDIVSQAGDKVMAIYRSGDFDTQIKSDRSPLTAADLASHQWITSRIEEEFNIPVISEEAEPPSWEERRHWTEFFLLDPLDGTKDFVVQNDEFTINLALIKEGQPQIGIVSAPALDELFVAERGNGAQLIKNGQTHNLPRKQPGTLTYARSQQHNNSYIDQLAKANALHEGRSMSSALKLPRLAEGEININLCSNHGFEWDVAPGHLMVTEVGGTLVDISTGKEPVYNKPDLHNNFLIGFTGELDWRKLKGFPEGSIG